MPRRLLVLCAALAGCASDPSDRSSSDGGLTAPEICGGTICNAPPDSSCQGATTLIVYSATGTCESGTCTYRASAQTCPSSCANGHCVQQPVPLVPGQSSPIAIAVDATSVYWTTFAADGSLMKASLTGQGVTTLAPARFSASVAVDATSVYWTSQDMTGSDGPELGSVMKASLSGQNPTALAFGQSSPVSVAVDADAVYWLNADFYRASGDEKLGMAGTVMTASLSGQNPVTLASGQYGPFGLALDSASVYWINLGGSVAKVGRSGQGLATLVSGQSDPDSIAAGANGVYWSNSRGGTVMMASQTGQNVTTIASGQTYPGGLAVDATGVYWVSGDSIMKASVTGQGATPIASGQNGPVAIALDATTVYWVNRGDSSGNGAIMKMAK